MKLIRDRKGQIRIIEAFFASLILMSCLALIPLTTIVTDHKGNLESTAQNVLISLNSNGHLAALIDAQNWAALKDCLESSLPLTTWFNLTVFDKNMNPLNPFPSSNAGAVSDKIASVTYICPSQTSAYTIYILQLQLSQVGS